MATRVVDDVIAVATSPACLAEVMNLLHRGLLANPVAEEQLNEILGRADSDVLTLDRDAGYVADDDEACTLTLAGADAEALLGVVEELVEVARRELQVVLCADIMSEHERTVTRPFYERAVEVIQVLLGDLRVVAACVGWAALVELTVRDGGLLVYHEQVVACGEAYEAATAALEQLLRGRSLARALEVFQALGALTEAVELSSDVAVAIDGGRDRVASLRVEVVRVDAETLELLGQDGSDDLMRRLLFDSATRMPVAQERRLTVPLLVVA